MDIENNSVLGLITTLQDCFPEFSQLCHFSGTLWCPGAPLFCCLVTLLSNYLSIVLLLCFLQTDGRIESNNGYPHDLKSQLSQLERKFPSLQSLLSAHQFGVTMGLAIFGM